MGELEEAQVTRTGSAVVPAGRSERIWTASVGSLSSQRRGEAGHLGSCPSLEVLQYPWQ